MKDIRVLKATPMYSGVITTCNQWEVDGESDGLIDTAKSQGVVKPHQTVIAVGSSARGVKVGDVVVINPTRFAVKQYADDSLKNGVVKQNVIIGYNFPIIDINGDQCLLITENDIDYIVNEYEEYDIDTIETSDLID